jgi:hypothetical protein
VAYVKAVIGWGLAIAVPVLLTGALFIPLPVTTSRSAAPTVQTARAPGRLDAPLDPQDLVTDPHDWKTPPAEPLDTIDLYGNEVTDAVAEYTIDRAGSLHELHSPQTELPRLGSPKS